MRGQQASTPGWSVLFVTAEQNIITHSCYRPFDIRWYVKADAHTIAAIWKIIHQYIRVQIIWRLNHLKYQLCHFFLIRLQIIYIFYSSTKTQNKSIKIVLDLYTLIYSIGLIFFNFNSLRWSFTYQLANIEKLFRIKLKWTDF